MTDIPAPGPTGYQPAQGEGLTSITVEVSPSRSYQKVLVSGTVSFPTPRSYSEALPAIEELHAALQEDALARLDELVGKTEAAKPAPAQAPAPTAPVAPVAPAPAPTPTSHQPVQLQWAQGVKPNDHGNFKYLPTSVLPTSDFIDQAKAQLTSVGLNPDDVKVFDNRTGQYGLESGNKGYSPGVVKVNEGTPLAAAMGGQKKIVANVDFDYGDGSIRVKLTKDGQSAAQALLIAQQLGGQQVAQQPADDELPF